MNMIRLFCSVARNVKTSELAQLRKSTGFTLSNCRKALELCNNDLSKAEEWLRSEAKRLGWEKAMKLQSRTASEGLIAIARAKNKVVMVEVNCETDFVARNEKFVSLAEIVANTCIAHPFPQSDTSMKKVMSNDEMGNLKTVEDEKLVDCVAKRIGELGENIVLRRAMCYEADNDLQVAVSVHPPAAEGKQVLTGKYGAFVAYQKSPESTGDINSIQDVGVKLCRHIIGVNPRRISPKDDSQNDEEALLDQDFVLNPELTVREMLDEHGLKVVDFHRFHCGEDEATSKAVESDGGESESKENELERRGESI